MVSRTSQTTNVSTGGTVVTASNTLRTSVHPEAHRPARAETGVRELDGQGFLPQLLDQALPGWISCRAISAAVPVHRAEPIGLVFDGLGPEHVVNAGGPHRPSRGKEAEDDNTGESDSLPRRAAGRDERFPAGAERG